MICKSGGVESVTPLGESSWDMMTGARAGLLITLRDGETRRVGVVVAGTGSTVVVMAVVKRCERSVRSRSVLSPTVAKGGGRGRIGQCVG